jgi:hypothetical protein
MQQPLKRAQKRKESRHSNAFENDDFTSAAAMVPFNCAKTF